MRSHRFQVHFKLQTFLEISNDKSWTFKRMLVLKAFSCLTD